MELARHMPMTPDLLVCPACRTHSGERAIRLEVRSLAREGAPEVAALLAGLCAPGGEIILSSPYAWQSTVMADDQRISDSDPAAAVRALLRDRFVIVEEAEIVWTLRRDARSSVTYQTDYIRARKGTSAPV